MRAYRNACDMAVVLDATEETLDQIAMPIKLTILEARGNAVGAWRDDRLRAGFDRFDQPSQAHRQKPKAMGAIQWDSRNASSPLC